MSAIPKAPLKVIFAGTPEFAALHLKALIDSEHQLTAVYTQPDRRAGRGKKLQASPVKQLALEANLPVMQPPTLKDAEAQQTLADLQADIMIVVAYGLILPQPVLDAPTFGCLNVHASLLPRWRGAAPIARAIEAGDHHTGVTIMQMDAGLDTGPMLATRDCAIGPFTTAASLHDSLAEAGPPLLMEVLDNLATVQSQAQAQPEEGATYAHKILKSEAELDWRDTATTLERKVRAFNPFPVCFSLLGDQRVRIWRASAMPLSSKTGEPGTIIAADEKGIHVLCQGSALRLEVLQLPGGKALPVSEILRAKSELFAPGQTFTLPEHSAEPG